MQLNEVKPYKHKMKIETLICFLVGSLIFAPGASADPDFPNLKFTDYTVENGLSYNSVLSICQDASGKMYFGGTDGVEVFHPDKMPVNTDMAMTHQVYSIPGNAMVNRRERPL